MRVHSEVRALGGELRRLAEVAGSRTEADVALLLDWPSWWGLELRSRPSWDLRLLDRVRDHYRPLWEARIACDVVPPDADLERYRLVVVPNLYMVSAADAARLVAFVAAGGHVLISFFSGIVDECDRLHDGGFPGPWRELLGLSVAEHWPLADGDRVEVREGERVWAADTWSEDLALDSAQALATFASGPLAGGAAVTRNAHGAGIATYVATRPERPAMAAIVQRAAEAAGVRPVLDGLPAGVEATRRGNHVFLLNHKDTAVQVPVPDGATDVLGGDGELAPLGAAVLRLREDECR